MGLDIWFAEDIRNALLAANEASAATAAVITEVAGNPQACPSPAALPDSTDLLAVSLRAYREGYKAALATIALAFGIAPQTIGTGTVREDERHEVDGGAGNTRVLPATPGHRRGSGPFDGQGAGQVLKQKTKDLEPASTPPKE